MEIPILLLLLLGLWAFIRYDQRRIRGEPVKAIDRKSFGHGYVPGLSEKWIGLLGVSMITGGAALFYLLKPPSPPFTGRWSWLYSALHGVLGNFGPAVFFGSVGIAFGIAAFAAFRSTAQQRKRQNAA